MPNSDFDEEQNMMEGDSDEMIDCTACGDGGCIYCEPDRFL